MPDDVTIVGFDDLEIASWPIFSVTSVRVDFAAMARRAAELLLARVANDTHEVVHEQFPVELVRRATHREL